VGLGHRRLSIIDLDGGAQPMTDGQGNWLAFNGEIYNYIELRQELGEHLFQTTSDTEVILHAYARWGEDCVRHFRGMFAFLLWDEERQLLFAARDPFGIKPLCYTVVDDVVYFASEAKALLPFVPAIETDSESLAEYLAFQFCLGGKTLFKGIRELPPGHRVRARHGTLEVRRYWEIYYEYDFDHTERYFEQHLRALMADSVRLHLRSDVPVGAYLSGGLDSSIIATLAGRQRREGLRAYTGRFAEGPEFDETPYAREVAEQAGLALNETTITADDFMESVGRVIYHLDYPVAGPGAVPQYLVSRAAARHEKVLLGGQGGDETFGGYTRYLIAYFEQCIKGAIDGTGRNGSFIVTYESIIPNLSSLRNYKPLLQEFWKEGLFGEIDQRYYRLINRTPDLGAVNPEVLGRRSPYDAFRAIFYGDNVRKESYFDLMTHFDFKTLLPALLHLEDRVSMAHGLESRVPFLDVPLVEFAATIPSNVKFANGTLKNVLRNAFGPLLPPRVANRQDKMGFPVPLNHWLKGPLRDFLRDVFSANPSRSGTICNSERVLEQLDREPTFGRQTWGFLCLELWQQQFHDRQAEFRAAFREIKDSVPAIHSRKGDCRHARPHHRRRRLHRVAPG
jgi:asparagine synthase (glutamine-hydrolysing)